MYDPNTGIIYLPMTGTNIDLGYTFMHEYTHLLQVQAPEEYEAYKNAVKDAYIRKYGEDGYKAKIEEIMTTYGGFGGKANAEDLALDEMVSDVAREFLNDENFVKNIASENLSLAKSILNAIKNVISKLRYLIAVNNNQYKDKLYSELDNFKELEVLWMNAVQTAKKSEAQRKIDEFGESKFLIVEDDSIKEQLSKNLTELNKMGVVADINVDNIPSSIDGKRKAISAEYKRLGNKVERRGYGTVILGDNEIGNSLGYLKGDAEYVAFYVVPKIIKRGIQIGLHTNHKDRGYSTSTFAGQVIINGVRGNVAVVVKESGKSRYKTHRIMSPDGKVFEYVQNKKEAQTHGVDTDNRDQRPLDTPSIEKLSLSPEDVNYLSAIQNNDTDTVQRMVDEKAEETFSESAIRDEDGKLRKMLHGTNAVFDAFDILKGGQTGRAEGFGFYFTNDEGTAQHYGKNQIPVYLNIKKPANDKKTIKLNDLKKCLKRLAEYEADKYELDIKDTWISNYENTYEQSMASVYDKVARQIRQNNTDKETIEELFAGMGIRNYSRAVSDVFEIITDTLGFDGIETEWFGNGLSANIVLAWYPEQIKSAAPVTYNNDGSIINLSERFDESRPEYKYSLSDPLYTKKQYNDFGWVRGNDVLTYKEYGKLNAVFQNNKGNLNKSFNGEWIVPVGEDGVNNKLVYCVGGTQIRKIIKVVEIMMGAENGVDVETDLSEIRRLIYDYEERYSYAIRYVKEIFGDELFREHSLENSRTYEGYTYFKQGSRGRANYQFDEDEDGGGSDRSSLTPDNAGTEVVDDNGTPVAAMYEDGSAKFSISSFEDKGRAELDKYLNKMVKKGELSQKEADQTRNELEVVYKICKKR